jgi:hypothetical protein
LQNFENVSYKSLHLEYHHSGSQIAENIRKEFYLSQKYELLFKNLYNLRKRNERKKEEKEKRRKEGREQKCKIEIKLKVE